MRRWARSKEYQKGLTSPWSVAAGFSESGLRSAMDLLTGPGLLAEWFCSPAVMVARLCAEAKGVARTAPALMAEAAAPRKERRLRGCSLDSRTALMLFMM